MKTLNTLLRLLALVALIGSSSLTFGQTVFVIANPGVSIAAGDVGDVFLGEKQFAGSVKIVPVDNGAMQEAFVGKALGLELGKYNTKWAKKSFRDGLTPPPVKSGDAEVIDYVKRTAGAVGYVGSAPAGVTVVTKY